VRPRLFVSPDPVDPDRAVLDAGAVRHLRALHLRRGDGFVAIVGPGREREGILERLGAHDASCRLGARLAARATDPGAPRILAVALADPVRLDLVVEKATELGASEIRPFRAARSQLATVPAARLERWRRIARAACEQSGRTVPPSIAPATTFAGLLDATSGPQPTFVFLPESNPRPPEPFLARARDGAIVVVGPEGGLTDDEVGALLGRGALRVGLGPRVLRVETAAIAALATLEAWLSGQAPSGVPEPHLR
jgi:16S rRNA (uracil1498-N3)-methyltransferase